MKVGFDFVLVVDLDEEFVFVTVGLVVTVDFLLVEDVFVFLDLDEDVLVTVELLLLVVVLVLLVVLVFFFVLVEVWDGSGKSMAGGVSPSSHFDSAVQYLNIMLRWSYIAMSFCICARKCSL